jgi:small nuclear ribonucleoprotein (snRNP)-like protein
MVEQYHVCRSCLHRKVRVHTVCGQTYQGVITDVDFTNLYLQVDHTGEVQTRAFFGRRNQILSLVLFDLLAIALL